MAIRQSDKIKAILFLFVTAVLGIILVLSLIGTQWLQKKDRYYIEFKEPVRGLNVGSTVRYHGVSVGKVQKIEFSINITVAVSRVTVEVARYTPVKVDSKAILEIDSLIVGNRFVQITPGTAEAPLLKPNDPDRRYLIETEKSGAQKLFTTIEDISKQMGPLIQNVGKMFSAENANSISSILAQVDLLIAHEEVSGKVGPLLENLNSMFSPDNVQMVSTLLYRVDHAVAMNSTNVDQALVEFRATMESMNEGIHVANGMMIQNQRNIAETLKNIRVVTQTLQELLEKINRQPSVLIRGSTANKEWLDE